MPFFEHTIVALATPLGQAPLGIIRISGMQALDIVSRIFRSKRDISTSPGHEVVFGYIFDPDNNHDIDQVLLTIFRHPRSFTGEDMIEVTCHGGIIIFQKILDLLIKYGCSLASRGEFSKRAFLNGKIDLTQAEAINDLILSRSSKVGQIILGSLKKEFYKKIQEIKASILYLVAKIEVGIDYPEDDLENWNDQDESLLKEIHHQIENITIASSQNRLANQGYTIAIIGEPNTGKSSLLNTLVGEEKAIVSDIAGTTRDPIEVFLNLDDIPVKLIDTAGLREKTDNEIEQKGVEKSKNIMMISDFTILVADISDYSSDRLHHQIQILETENIPFILVWNKIDLCSNFSKEKFLSEKKQLLLSCKNKSGIQEFVEFLRNSISYVETTEIQFFVNQRQDYLMENIKTEIVETLQKIKINDISPELLSLSLQKVLHIIGEMDGSDIQENILDMIFSKFCVGK